MQLQIVRQSPYTGKFNTITVDVTQEQIESYVDGAPIQNAFPHLSKAEREFILTGYTQEDWDAMFNSGDEG